MQKLTQSDFTLKATVVHNGKYSYKEVNYINNKTKVTITCKEHGNFDQIPVNHLKGAGCPHCHNQERHTYKQYSLEDFIVKANEQHNSKYTYDKTNYVKSNVKVTITCPIHGDFEQTPAMHLSGNGCPSCAKNKKLTVEDFVKTSNAVHNSQYSYEKVEIQSSHNKVIITCPTHGDFAQTPSSHLAGRGCPLCAKSGYKVSKPGLLYVLKIKGYDNLYKIGITNLTVNKRFTKTELTIIDTLFTKQFTNGKECLDKETELLQRFSNNKADLTILESGNTELVYLTEEEITHLWTELASL